jgi:hypothetical protein
LADALGVCITELLFQLQEKNALTTTSLCKNEEAEDEKLLALPSSSSEYSDSMEFNQL